MSLLSSSGSDLERALGATETKFFSKDGKVLDERTVVNETARAKARDQVFDLTDVLRPRSDTTAGTRPVIVNIKMPDWAKPMEMQVSESGDTCTVS